MANFRIGDRVKVTGHVLEPGNQDFRGMEGRIATFESYDILGLTVGVMLDAMKLDSFPLMFAPRELSPLTPPAADTWATDKVRDLVKPRPMDLERQPSRTREPHNQGSGQ